MSEELNEQPSMSYYIIAGVFLAWNLIGLMFYYQQMTMTPEIMQAAEMTAAQMAWMDATPVWANAAYATAVTLGVLASILLLLRNSFAFPAYVVSFACIIIQDIESFVLRSPTEAWGGGAYVIPVLVFAIAVIEIWYSKSVANRYYR